MGQVPGEVVAAAFGVQPEGCGARGGGRVADHRPGGRPGGPGAGRDADAAAFGDDLDELLNHLDAWSEAIITAGSYPQRIAGVYSTGGGPHFGSGLTIDTVAEAYENRA